MNGVGGNLEHFPRRAITMGMKQCLEARKMLLMTRNETPTFLWANTIHRIAALETSTNLKGFRVSEKGFQVRLKCAIIISASG